MISKESWRCILFTAWIIAVVVAAFFAFVRYAKAHGNAQWIQDGAYKNAIGELCCGKRDCFELADDQVTITRAGYRVALGRSPGGIAFFETVPFSEATPSPDGKYWRCQWGGSRKCFFAPPGQT